MRHQIYPDRKLVVSWYEDQMDPADFVSYLADVGANPVFKPDFRLVAIFADDLDLSNLSVEAIRNMQAAEVNYLKREDGAFAIIIARGEMVELMSLVYTELAAAEETLATDIRLVSTAAETEALLNISLADIPMPDFAR